MEIQMKLWVTSSWKYNYYFRSIPFSVSKTNVEKKEPQTDRERKHENVFSILSQSSSESVTQNEYPSRFVRLFSLKQERMTSSTTRIVVKRL